MADHTRGPAGAPTDGAAGAGSAGNGATPGDGATDDGARGTAGRGRLWAVLAAVVVVIGVVVAVLLLVNRPQAPEAPEPAPQAETVTLPPPTPTIDPVPLPEGASPFLQALPQVVLAYALTEVSEEPALLAEGALEAYRLVYEDGGRQIVATAGQWRSAEAVEARFDEVVAAEAAAAGVPVEQPGADGDAAEEGAADEGADAGGEGTEAAPTVPRLEQGFVEVDGQQVGRFLQLTRTDGTGSLWWTNGTALLRLDGPGDALRDVYAAFPL
ncbi:hypothetical protein [Actinotalea sp. Marseille-Q4924]|uniref:hypothetical protein n=1 Tax=Actinotalea sp. Marseille-Q4924 TaxID=2866571 RepID=UPI001CE4B204|nr:hypothetical protein [Actinotalea sp. Marseille-Q4924]